MLSEAFIKLLICPETHEPVTLLDDSLLGVINTKIREGIVHNRKGEKVENTLQAGLIRKDQKYIYPIYENIPVMLIEKGIPLEQG
ncbi:hypothetical protein WDW89_08815 [Deltaproteobacteria bacterium TL4]